MASLVWSADAFSPFTTSVTNTGRRWNPECPNLKVKHPPKFQKLQKTPKGKTNKQSTDDSVRYSSSYWIDWRLSVSEDLPESVPVAVDSQPEQSSEMEIPAQTVEDIVDDKKKTTAVTSRRNRTKGRNMFQLTNVSPPRSR